MIAASRRDTLRTWLIHVEDDEVWEETLQQGLPEQLMWTGEPPADRAERNEIMRGTALRPPAAAVPFAGSSSSRRRRVPRRPAASG